MGTVNIEWVNIRKQNANVQANDYTGTVDIKPANWTDTSFQILATTTTSADSDTAPTDTTHALVSSVSGTNLVRKTTAPTTTTGGICITPGASRLIQVEEGEALKIVAAS